MHQNQINQFKAQKTIILPSLILIALIYCLASISSEAANEQPLRPWLKNRGLLSRSVPANPPPSPSPSPQPAAPTSSSTTSAPVASESQPAHSNANRLSSSLLTSGTGTAVEVAAAAPPPPPPPPSLKPARVVTPQQATNRTIRTAEIFDNNIVVTNTCERESMKVNIRMNRDFYGVIHTRNQRSKQICSIEGNGDREYNLEISHVLNNQDPNYCGVIRARKDSPEDKDILSVVIAVRVHRNIELSDDKFFLLNCTNRCRKADCSSPTTNARLADLNESANDETTINGERENNEKANSDARDRNPGLNDECNIWRFPHIIWALWALGILLLASIILNCFICSSMICRCVKKEVEETEPSIYEGASDYDDDVLNRSNYNYNKKSPYTIDYDNRDIYKTSNNYAPYSLEEAQTKSSSRQKKHRKSSR